MAGPPSDDSRRTGSRDGSSSPARRGRRERASLAGVVRLLVTVTLLCALVLGAALVGPQLVADLEEFDGTDEFDRLEGLDRLDDISGQPAVSPSSDPPPAGERNPELTDPDDPGESTYETHVETVSAESVEDFVHAGVNDRRAEHDLESLEWDGTVASVSRAHSDDMAERQYFSHVNQEEETPFDRFDDVADYCQAYGENIAMTWVDTPVSQPDGDESAEYYTAEGVAEGLVEQWMNSPDHRAAILEEDVDGWDRGGVGVYITDEGQVFATHNFCTEW